MSPPDAAMLQRLDAVRAVHRLETAVRSGDATALHAALAIHATGLLDDSVVDALERLKALREAVVRGDPAALKLVGSKAVTTVVTALAKTPTTR